MSTKDIQPANTKKTKDAAVAAFERFLANNQVSKDLATKCIANDPSGAVLHGVMDKFGMHLIS